MKMLGPGFEPTPYWYCTYGVGTGSQRDCNIRISDRRALSGEQIEYRAAIDQAYL